MSEDQPKKEEYSHARRRGREGGPKTFRRGRALVFLERMQVKRKTIKQQLDQPEFQSIHSILVGELKAIDMVINEFSLLFDINEDEVVESKKKSDLNVKGIEIDETN